MEGFWKAKAKADGGRMHQSDLRIRMEARAQNVVKRMSRSFLRLVKESLWLGGTEAGVVAADNGGVGDAPKDSNACNAGVVSGTTTCSADAVLPCSALCDPHAPAQQARRCLWTRISFPAWKYGRFACHRHPDTLSALISSVPHLFCDSTRSCPLPRNPSLSHMAKFFTEPRDFGTWYRRKAIAVKTSFSSGHLSACRAFGTPYGAFSCANTPKAALVTPADGQQSLSIIGDIGLHRPCNIGEPSY